MARVTAKQLKTNKVNTTTFTLGDKEYEMKFDFNVMCELEEVYGDISLAMEDLQKTKVKAIRALIYSIIKIEDDSVTLKGIGAMLDMNFITEFSTKFGNKMSVVLEDSMPAKTEGDEEEAKN